MDNDSRTAQAVELVDALLREADNLRELGHTLVFKNYGANVEGLDAILGKIAETTSFKEMAALRGRFRALQKYAVLNVALSGKKVAENSASTEVGQITDMLPLAIQRWDGSIKDLSDMFHDQGRRDLSNFVSSKKFSDKLAALNLHVEKQ